MVDSLLAQHHRPRCVGFLSNVDGVYSSPPHRIGAKLIPVIEPHTDAFQTRTMKHDVTGGIRSKVAVAQTIQADSMVFISQASNSNVKEVG